jgi:hypothetical protein
MFYVPLTVFCTTASSWCVRFESPCIKHCALFFFVQNKPNPLRVIQIRIIKIKNVILNSILHINNV